MLRTYLYIEGEQYGVRSAARRLGLGRNNYCLATDLIPFGPSQGEAVGMNRLQILISDRRETDRHLRQLEDELTELLPFLLRERLRYGDSIRMRLHAGMTIGGDKYFTRTFVASPQLIKMLAAADIELDVSGYPCHDHKERERLKWSEGVGLAPR